MKSNKLFLTILASFVLILSAITFNTGQTSANSITSHDACKDKNTISTENAGDSDCIETLYASILSSGESVDDIFNLTYVFEVTGLSGGVGTGKVSD